MNKVDLALPLLTMLLAASVLPAQKDVIVLRDGTSIRGVKVLSWTAKEIKFKTKSGSDTRPSHMVERAQIEKVREAVARAGNSPADLVTVADTNKSDPLVAASALHKAAMLFYDDGNDTDAIEALRMIDESYADSPFAPEYHRWKIRYYLGKKKPDYKNAALAAQKYGDASRTRTWSRAYQLDAEFWERIVEGASGKVQPARFISAMQDLVGRANSAAPFVAHEAAVNLADTYRKQKKYAEAKTEYSKLAEQKGLSADVRARMYLGLGYISLEEAISGKEESARKEALYEAYKSFLRVYLNAREAHPEIVAEGLFNAAKACEQWGELASCSRMAGILRGRLKLHEPYKHTSWANKR